jgi:phage baseplate assembly protein W
MKAIHYPFNVTFGLVEPTRSYEDVVRGQVIDALMTNRGERVMRPRYGCDVQAALFDPQDELMRRDAASVLKERLSQYVPRAFIRDVKVEISLDDPRGGIFEPGAAGAVVISVTYRVSMYGTDTTVTVPTSSEFVARSISEGGFTQ